MRSVMVASLAMSLLACSAARPEPPRELARTATPAPPPPPARVTGCVAKPSTVYGDEPVVFELTGDAEPARSVDVTIVDLRGTIVSRASTGLPGVLNAGQLPSGDFALELPGFTGACRVTVNRELSRGSGVSR